MTFRNAWVSLAIPTLALALVSCETAGNKDANGNSAATTGSADSMSLAGFFKNRLQTAHEVARRRTIRYR